VRCATCGVFCSEKYTRGHRQTARGEGGCGRGPNAVARRAESRCSLSLIDDIEPYFFFLCRARVRAGCRTAWRAVCRYRESAQKRYAYETGSQPRRRLELLIVFIPRPERTPSRGHTRRQTLQTALQVASAPSAPIQAGYCTLSMYSRPNLHGPTECPSDLTKGQVTWTRLEGPAGYAARISHTQCRAHTAHPCCRPNKAEASALPNRRQRPC
jgi:hypothetical protein